MSLEPRVLRLYDTISWPAKAPEVLFSCVDPTLRAWHRPVAVNASGKSTTLRRRFSFRRGLAQAPRLALELAGEPYDDVRIDAGDPGAADYKQNW